MRSILFRVAILLAIMVAASGWWHARWERSTVLADAAGKAERPGGGQNGYNCVSTVPKNWGVYRGGSQQSGLSFEGADGTLRFVTNLPCDGSTPLVALEIRRSAPPANQ
jgi:hypothetical protein